MLEFEQVYNEVVAFVYWLAQRDEMPHVWLMDKDELVGELMEEVVKVFDTYSIKIAEMDEMLALIRTSLDNRISELRYKYTVTHRKSGIYEMSLDSSLDMDGEDDYDPADALESAIVMNIGATVGFEVASMYESKERVELTRSRLSPNAQLIFDAVIHGDPMVQAQVKLSGIRASAVYKGTGTIRVKEFHVANALGIPDEQVKQLFAEIRDTYAEVCDEFQY